MAFQYIFARIAYEADFVYHAFKKDYGLVLDYAVFSCLLFLKLFFS